MTLSKLSLRNAKRQAGDYLVYFVTIVMAAALIYAFNGLIFSEEVQELSQLLKSLPLTIVLASMVVVGIIRWLVSYTTNFMLTRRSREFGTYILIGLENRQVARLFFLENLMVGGAALAIGVLLGNLLYQALRAIVLALFGMPYAFSFFFSARALGLTLLYFVLVYLSVQMKSRKRIRGMKIYDLIYYEKQNQSAVIRTGPNRRRIFVLSLVLGIAGSFLLMIGDLLFGLIGAGCVIAFLYGFFLCFASGVPAFFDRRPARKYRKQNLLVFRTLTAKLASMGILMATIALLFTATLISEGTGMIFRAIFRNRTAQNSCFDMILSGDVQTEAFRACKQYMDENIPVRDSRQYPVYLAKDDTVSSYLESDIEYYRYYDVDTVMRASDYAALRSMLGYDSVTLAQGQYLIHCRPYVAAALRNWNRTLAVGGQTLAPAGLRTEVFAQQAYDVNGNGFILVVPDAAAEGCAVDHTMYVALTEQPVGAVQQDTLDALLYEAYAENGYSSDMLLYTRTAAEAEVAAMTAMTVFPLFYLALVLTMTAAAILTVQQLSETDRYRRQFTLLRKLGMDRREMARALRIQFAVYYAMPAIPPVLIGVPFIVHLAGATEPGIMVGASAPAAIAGIALGLFFAVYAVYILLAYTGLRRNVLPE